MLENIFLNLQRVFHGIRFKVRGLVVERQLIFFYFQIIPIFQIAPIIPISAKKKKPPVISHRRLLEGGGYLLSRCRSTIGVIRFNFSVRNGKRWSPYAIFTLIFSLSPCAGSVLSLGKGFPEAGETSAKPSHNRLWSVLFVFVDELLHLSFLRNFGQLVPLG